MEEVMSSYREMMIDKLAQQLYTAYTESTWGEGVKFQLDTCAQTTRDAWTACAEAAVDELIDRPEREFQASLAAIIANNHEADSMGAWVPAIPGAWT